MREVANRSRVERFMELLGSEVTEETHVYFTGGASALLYGWRDSTIDIDIKLDPDRDSVLRAIPAIKDSLKINVELASPADFVPVREDWKERSPFVRQVGRTFFHNFDLYAQALSKIVRGHDRDIEDVRAMVRLRLVDPHALRDYFSAVEPSLYRYPSLDPPSVRAAVERCIDELTAKD